ncbi:hypothetical protein NP493_1097g00004 [Ridgeia piscesae]|uniref:IGFBP N-terminal domain-containing protein n=1 Tax=Ridgeia piscesae TaxID=27915 RepID=A0AAD9KH84_RIDPI|nr:hypothetical protein NP493_1097g00004 [Ridgeia piscesae]
MPCEYNVTCPCLPDDCQKGLRPCGCCYECKGKVGSKCSGLLVPCESGLMCVNSKGIGLPQVYWYDFTFHGTCEKVDSCQVITNYNTYDYVPLAILPE